MAHYMPISCHQMQLIGTVMCALCRTLGLFVCWIGTSHPVTQQFFAACCKLSALSLRTIRKAANAAEL